MLKVQNLTFSYTKNDKTFQFELDSAPGTITAVIGPSGIGKSTFLGLLAGFLTPISGSLLFNGTDISNTPVEQRPVSILFQADNLFDHLDVKTNLTLALQPNHPNKSERILAALSEVGLENFANARASNLSGGQQQRVALARTLLRNKPILLLDEPFANLDKDTAATMRKLIKSLTHKNGWHTILVSHLSADATDYADNIYKLD